MRIKPALAALVVLTAPVLATAQENADTHPFLQKRFFATLGIFFPDRSFKFGADGTATTTNSTVDFSEQFRLGGTDETGAFEFGWRFSEEWLMRAQYFVVNGSAPAVLQEDIAWGDAVFNTGTEVRAGTEIGVTRLFVGRHFRGTDDYQIGIGGGLHWLELEAFIRGDAIVNGVDAGFRDEAVSANGPLPNIGAWYMHSLSGNLAVTVRLDWLSASVDKYDGRIVNAAVSLNYAISQNVGVGVSYNYFELDLRVNDSSWQGRTKIRLDGAYVYIGAYW